MQHDNVDISTRHSYISFAGDTLTTLRCAGIFKCMTVDGSRNGGCAASSLYDILTQPTFGIMDAPGRDAVHGLKHRDELDDGLFNNGELLMGRVVSDANPSEHIMNTNMRDAHLGDEDSGFDTE